MRRQTRLLPNAPRWPPWDSAVTAQAEYEKLIASALSVADKEQLYDLLRRLMGAFSKDSLEAGKRVKPGRRGVEDDD